jgi:hypothetical protein
MGRVPHATTSKLLEILLLCLQSVPIVDRKIEWCYELSSNMLYFLRIIEKRTARCT